MIDLSYLVKGITIGVSIAAPVGPIGMICIRRSLTEGRLAGFISGLGVASADAIYGLVAGLGLTTVANFLTQYTGWLRLGGGLFLAYLGVTSMIQKSSPVNIVPEQKRLKLGYVYLTTFLLTLSNPVTILSFAGVMLGVGIKLSQHGAENGAVGSFVGGIFIGSTLWWLILSNLAEIFRLRMKQSIITWINRISGLVIMGFGIYTLFSLMKMSI